MNVRELKAVLAAHPNANLRFVLPDGAAVPAHAHVTEVASDLEHRLTVGKLLGILDKAASLLGSEELEVDVEHEVEWISQFPLKTAAAKAGELFLQLGVRHTACLAEDKCLPKPSVMSIDFKALPSFAPRG